MDTRGCEVDLHQFRLLTQLFFVVSNKLTIFQKLDQKLPWSRYTKDPEQAILDAMLKEFILLVLTSGVCLAQIITMGSNLNTPPNINLGCDLKPVIANPEGDYVLIPSGTPDCTWRQSGVFGVPNDSRFSSVPGDGFITSFSVRSGPNPAPISLVVLRQIGTGGFAGECCFFRRESALVQPAPNAVSTFAVNIPVERNTINGFQAIDLVGISAPSNRGSLPLAIVQTPNAFNLTTPGSVNAGFFYPRIGSLPNDTGGGRREDGIPGIEVLFNFTWCSRSLSGPLGCFPGGPGPRVLGGTIRARNNRVPIQVLCNRNAVCEGILQLLTGARAANGGRPSGLSDRIEFKVKSGKSKTYRVSLNKRGKKLLNRSPGFGANIWIKPKRGQGKVSNTFVSIDK